MPNDLTTTVSIGRTELGLTTLVLTPETGYYVQRDGFSLGEVSYRRQQAESIYVPGKVLVHRQKDLQSSSLKVRVTGTTQTDLYTKMTTIATAFEQFNYSMSVTVGDKVFSFTSCDCADYSAGEDGVLQDMHLRALTQMMTFTIPHQPVSVGFFTS